MKWVSLFVPVHLAPLHCNHVHLCPVLSSFHVFILLSALRAHARTFALTVVFRLSSERRVCVCNPWNQGNLLVWNRGRDGRFPSHANEAMEIDWMEVWTQTSVAVPLFRKTGGNGTRHTCVSVPFLLFPLGYSTGLQVGLQTLLRGSFT